jgi:hypothetical protein
MKLSDYYFFMPIYRCAKIRWKISQNKICHFWQVPLAATEPLWNIFFITEWIALKLKILTNIKIIFFKTCLRKTTLFHNQPSSFCSRYPNVCDRTKKIDYNCLLPSSAFALYIERFAYYCGLYFVPFRPSKFRLRLHVHCLLRRGVHSRLHIYPLCGIFCLPWHRHSGTRIYVSFKGRGNRSNVTCPRSQARWSVTSIEPTMFGSQQGFREKKLGTELTPKKLLNKYFFRGMWPLKRFLHLKMLKYAPMPLNTITSHGNCHYQQGFISKFGYISLP